MKSFYAALIFSIALIYASFVFTNKIESVSQVLSDKTHSAYTSLRQNDIDNARIYFKRATDEFEKNRVLLEATGNHEELLRIEIAYFHAKEFMDKDQIGDALASLSEVQLLLKHLPGNFEIKPENIL